MWKNLRRSYWLTQEFFKRHFGVILKTITVVLVLAIGLTLSIRYIPGPRPVTRIGLIGKYTTETLPLTLQAQLSSGLITMDEEGLPQPALASSWEVSEDGLTYTFILNPALTWHDGTPLASADLNYNFKDVQIEKGDGRITFKLKEPFAPFFYAVEKPVLKQGLYGVGEYRLGKCVVYASVVQSCPLVSDRDKKIYKFYPTENAAITAFKLGEVDYLENLSYLPTDISNEPRFSITPNTHYPRIAVLFLNNNDATLQSKPARQALAYAIRDKSFGHSRALSPVGSNSWAFNPLVKEYDYDPERAKSLFAQDIQDPAGVTLELKTTLQYLDVAETVADNWREVLGVGVNVKVVSTIGTDYQALLIDYASPADPDQYTTWHSTQPGNLTRYTNLKVDKLLEDGRRTQDRKLRREIYQDFQRFLLEDSPAIFLFNTNSYDLSRKPIF